MFNQAQRFRPRNDAAGKRGRLRSFARGCELRDRLVLHRTAACDMHRYSARVANSLMTYAADLGSSFRLFERRLRRSVRSGVARTTPTPVPAHCAAELACVDCGAIASKLV